MIYFWTVNEQDSFAQAAKSQRYHLSDVKPMAVHYRSSDGGHWLDDLQLVNNFPLKMVELSFLPLIHQFVSYDSTGTLI